MGRLHSLAGKYFLKTLSLSFGFKGTVFVIQGLKRLSKVIYFYTVISFRVLSGISKFSQPGWLTGPHGQKSHLYILQKRVLRLEIL